MINVRNNSDITNILTSLIVDTQSPDHFYNTPARRAGEKNTGVAATVWRQSIFYYSTEAALSRLQATWFRANVAALCPALRAPTSIWRYKCGLVIRAQRSDGLGQLVYLFNRVVEPKRDAIHRWRHQLSDDDILLAQLC